MGNRMIWLLIVMGTLLAQGAPAEAADYALLVGVGTYKEGKPPSSSSSGLTNLLYSSADAERIKSVLVGQGMPTGNIRMLTDSQATGRAIRESLEWLSSKSSEGNTVYFYFSGHGSGSIPDLDGDEKARNSGDTTDEALLAYDVMDLTQREPRELARIPDLAAQFFNGLVLDDQVYSFAKGCKGRTVIIVDACFSGGVMMSGAEAAAEPVLLTKAADVIDPAVVALLLKGTKDLDFKAARGPGSVALEVPDNTVFLSASTERQPAVVDTRLKASWFTYYLTQAALSLDCQREADLNKDRKVSLEEAFQFASVQVRIQGKPQTKALELLALAGRIPAQQPTALNLKVVRSLCVASY